MSRCPECESDLDLDGYEVDAGESIHCPECSVELVVASTDPIVLRSPDEGD
jgi:lysine biosynthesis protein LysW